jgi:hypothetical protein
MIKIQTFKQFLLESFSDAKRVWMKQGYNVDAIDRYITYFKTFKERKFLKDKEKDITYWIPKPFSEFQNFIDMQSMEFARKTSKKEKETSVSKDVIKVFENKYVLVIIPTTHEASCKYGRQTTWCITGFGDGYSGEGYWNDYVHNDGLTPFFFLFKKEANITKYRTGYNSPGQLEKICIMVDTEGDEDCIYDAGDGKIEFNTDYYDCSGAEGTDEDEEITLEEIFEKYDIGVFDMLYSALEEYQDGDIGEVVNEYFETTSFEELYDELIEYYTEHPKEKVITKYDIVAYVEAKVDSGDIEADNFKLGFGDIDDFVNSPTTKSYMVTKILNNIAKEMESFVESRSDSFKIKYKFQ